MHREHNLKKKRFKWSQERSGTRVGDGEANTIINCHSISTMIYYIKSKVVEIRCDVMRGCRVNKPIFIYLDNKGTFHGQALRILHRDPNLGVLTASQQPTLRKFRVSLVVWFKPKTMYHLLGPHFLVFVLTNWPTLASAKPLRLFMRTQTSRYRLSHNH